MEFEFEFFDPLIPIELNKVYNVDCIGSDGMCRIHTASIDMILCDLPYGTTDCKWDSIIPFPELWKEYERIIKDNGVIVLTSSQPFTTEVINSNRKLFKYEWIWVKNHSTMFQHAKNRPMKKHEDVLIFSKGSMGHENLLKEKRMKYNPQGINSTNGKVSYNTKNKWGSIAGKRPSHKESFLTESENYPETILFFDGESKGFHPTQKPVALFEYLIKTYTDENDIVLDNCMGSFTTAIACIESKRNYIGFELDTEYYIKGNKRIENWHNEKAFKGTPLF